MDFFKLRENNTTVRTEILAGLTTFMTMAYIIALNPNLLTGFAVGTPLWNGVFLATCIASAVGTICMAFLANKPFAMAPGMGLNTFFATVCANVAAVTGAEYETAFQAVLCIILIEGILFIILSAYNIREKIITAIPLGIRVGIAPAMGLMLMNIGFGSNAGVYAEGNGYSTPFFMLRDFFGTMTPGILRDSMGAEYTQMVISVITVFIGLIIIILLSMRRINAAVLLGMLAASVFYWICDAVILRNNPFAGITAQSFVPPFDDMASMTLMKFDFVTLFRMGILTVVTLIITFCMIDMFDTIGTLVGTATRAGMMDDEGSMPGMREALMSDAIGTVVGACTGTSTVTTFIESSSGVEAGGRTGLTALTTGIIFLLCIFLAPFAAVIPPAATSCALIYVGIIMLQGLRKVDLNDMDQLVPVSVMLLAMPITGSIGNAIGIAMILYTLLKICAGKAKEISVLTGVVSVLFLIKFFVSF